MSVSKTTDWRKKTENAESVTKRMSSHYAPDPPTTVNTDAHIIVGVINLTNRTYKRWRDVCWDYADITGTLDCLYLLLKRLEAHLPTTAATEPSFAQKEALRRDLSTVVRAARGTVNELDRLLNKFQTGKSRSKNWERIRFGAKDLPSLRTRLMQHVSSISAFLNVVELESIGRIDRDVTSLPDAISQRVSIALGNFIDARQADNKSIRGGSIMTDYTDDDKDVWKHFRSECVRSGITSENLKKFRPELKRFLQSITYDDQTTTTKEPLERSGESNPTSSDSDSQQDSRIEIAEREAPIAGSITQSGAGNPFGARLQNTMTDHAATLSPEEMKKLIEAMKSKLPYRSASPLSDAGSDEKQSWKQSRRKMVQNGMTGSQDSVGEYEHRIERFLQERAEVSQPEAGREPAQRWTESSKQNAQAPSPSLLGGDEIRGFEESQVSRKSIRKETVSYEPAAEAKFHRDKGQLQPEVAKDMASIQIPSSESDTSSLRSTPSEALELSYPAIAEEDRPMKFQEANSSNDPSAENKATKNMPTGELGFMSLEELKTVFISQPDQRATGEVQDTLESGGRMRNRYQSPTGQDRQPLIPSTSSVRHAAHLQVEENPESVEGQSYPISIWLAALRKLLRVLRPSVRKGFERLEWTCSCGKVMYGDYARSERLLETELMRVLTSHIGGTASTITGSPMVSTFNDEKIALNQLPAKINAGSSGSVGLPSTEDNGEPSGKAGKSGDDILGRSAEVQSATHPTTSWSKSPAFFELCVNRSETLISLGEITLVDDRGHSLVNSDIEHFSKIKTSYEDLRRPGLFKYLFRPQDIHFVRFGVRQGGSQTGIYKWPLAIPPEVEVQQGRYHYHECPLDPLPPIDSRTFFHYFWEHASHPITTGNVAFDTLFMKRLPKKLGSSIFLQRDPGSLNLGWGVHIIEGPNKPLIAWLGTVILIISFMVSIVYDLATKNKDSGFAIGQWIVAVLSTSLMALIYHLGETV